MRLAYFSTVSLRNVCTCFACFATAWLHCLLYYVPLFGGGRVGYFFICLHVSVQPLRCFLVLDVSIGVASIHCFDQEPLHGESRKYGIALKCGCFLFEWNNANGICTSVIGCFKRFLCFQPVCREQVCSSQDFQSLLSFLSQLSFILF